MSADPQSIQSMKQVSRPAGEPEEFGDLRQQIIESANKNQPIIKREQMVAVRRILNENDLVMCVWEEATAPYGVGMMVVKGAPRLRRIVSEVKTHKLRIAGIHAICAEQAEALRQVHGDASLS